MSTTPQANKNTRNTIIAVAAFFLLPCVIAVLSPRLASPPRRTTPARQARTGAFEDRTLTGPGGGAVLAAVDEDSYRALVETIETGNAQVLVALELDGRILRVPTGTRVYVEHFGLTKYNVRLMSGDYVGRTVIVHRSFVSQ